MTTASKKIKAKRLRERAALLKEALAKKKARSVKLARRSEKSSAEPVKQVPAKKSAVPAPKVKKERVPVVKSFEVHPELSELDPQLAETLTFVHRFRNRRKLMLALKDTDHLRVPMLEGRAYYRVRLFTEQRIVALQWIRKRGQFFELRTGRKEHGVYPSTCIPFADKQKALNAIRELI